MELLISDCLARTSYRFSSAVEIPLVLLEPSAQTMLLETHPATSPPTDNAKLHLDNFILYTASALSNTFGMILFWQPLRVSVEEPMYCMFSFSSPNISLNSQQQTMADHLP